MEIYADILKASLDGARKSHIVYKANLNFKIVKKYLDGLRVNGLITSPDDDNQVFKTTEKGIKFLEHFKGLRNFVNLSTIPL